MSREGERGEHRGEGWENGEEGYRPLRDYAMIGDGRTGALVSVAGSIDWCCLPAFDSPAVFLRLLDWRRGGFFQVAPEEHFTSQQAYAGMTNILQTTFEGSGGRIRLTDFMLPWGRESEAEIPSRIYRLVEGLEGEVDVKVRFKPTFDYARGEVTLEGSPGEGWLRACGADARLVMEGVDGWREEREGEVSVRRRVCGGERWWVVLTAGEGEVQGEAAPERCVEALERSRAYWRDWVEAISYEGPWSAEVRRSALVLRLLIHQPSGALVAAPTTSLPEWIGGRANWDYRFTWLRDSGLILDVLQMLGHHGASERFFDWLEGLCLCGDDLLQPIYRIDGSRDLPEETLDHLEGYRGSRPVRIGNGAAHQDQLDIYGHVLDAAWLCFSRMPREMSDGLWDILRRLADRAADRWRQPDRGIWEIRGKTRHFLYSKLFSWVAVDRALRLADMQKREGDRDRWLRERIAIRKAILERGYSRERGAFTQSLGGTALDASVLAIPNVGFLRADDPRMSSTLARVREELAVDGMVRRYLPREDMGSEGGSEGAFLMCSFWVVENLALQGRLREATDLFEELLGHASPLGLLAEELDPGSGDLLGNYPQGYTHLALIRAALTIHRVAEGKEPGS